MIFSKSNSTKTEPMANQKAFAAYLWDRIHPAERSLFDFFLFISIIILFLGERVTAELKPKPFFYLFTRRVSLLSRFHEKKTCLIFTIVFNEDTCPTRLPCVFLFYPVLPTLAMLWTKWKILSKKWVLIFFVKVCNIGLFPLYYILCGLDLHRYFCIFSVICFDVIFDKRKMRAITW